MGSKQAAVKKHIKTPGQFAADWDEAAEAARKAEQTPARLAEIAREREESAKARRDAREPVEMKPGTKVKVSIRGWCYDPRPAEVVSDNMDRTNRKITAKRLRAGVQEERVTVRYENVILWRG